MTKTIKINKGVIAFYIIIALVSLLCALRINNLNIIGSNNSNNTYETHYA